MLAFPVAIPSIRRCLQALVILLVAAGALTASADQNITLRSGNGTVGSQDTQVRFLAYGTTGNITPTAQQFLSAQTGTFAYIDNPYGTYVQKLPTDPLAQWIGTTNALGSGSALYAIPFTVTDTVIAAASLDFGYAVDNAVNGIYINGMPISNNILDGDYHGEYYVLRSDIASLLQPNAVNWLYVNAADYGAFAGLIYSATITTQGATPSAPTITPANGGNSGSVSVRVIGSGFQESNAKIALTGVGSAINATNVTVVSPNIVTGTLDLNGVTPGARTVTVTTTDDTGKNPSSTVLPNAFSVQQGGAADVTVQSVGTPSVLGRIEWFFITVTNSGTVDSGPTAVTAALEPWSTYIAATPTPSSIEPLVFPATPYPALLFWNIPNIPAGGSVLISYAVEQDPKFPVGDTVVSTACTSYELSVIAGYCAGQLQASLTLEATKCSGFPAIGDSCVQPVVKDFGAFAKCMAKEGAQCGQSSSNVRGSVDPNDIVGPPGYGSAGWFRPDPPFQYTLSFNNLPTATNPATNVYLTDTFDPTKFDLSTLSIDAVTIGNASYPLPIQPLATQAVSHDIDLRPAQDLIVRVVAGLDPATNRVGISFLSLDPATGLEPTDATIGFLAPGAGGSIVFNVTPKPGLKTNAVIQDQGSVVFDSNDAIETPVWTNTVDITAPVSHVVALPASEKGLKFPVSWTGTDKGTGIQSYSVYVSDNGGPFTPWLVGSMGISSTYPGKIHHTYAFYSIATDYVGNVEAAKVRADAHTKVSPVVKTVLAASTKDATIGTVIKFTAAVEPASPSDPAPAGTVDFYSAGTILIGKANLVKGKASISTSTLAAGSRRITAIYRGDPAYPASGSNAIELTIVKLRAAVKLSSSADPAKAGSSITFKAAVSGKKGKPAGMVTFYVDGKAVGKTALALGDASYSTKFAKAGRHSIKAIYAGNKEFAEETSNVIEETVQ